MGYSCTCNVPLRAPTTTPFSGPSREEITPSSALLRPPPPSSTSLPKFYDVSDLKLTNEFCLVFKDDNYPLSMFLFAWLFFCFVLFFLIVVHHFYILHFLKAFQVLIIYENSQSYLRFSKLRQAFVHSSVINFMFYGI